MPRRLYESCQQAISKQSLSAVHGVALLMLSNLLPHLHQAAERRSVGAGPRCGTDCAGRELHRADLPRPALLPPPHRCLHGSCGGPAAPPDQSQCQRLPAHELQGRPGEALSRPPEKKRLCLAGASTAKHECHQALHSSGSNAADPGILVALR
jgi:hypothetical protein